MYDECANSDAPDGERYGGELLGPLVSEIGLVAMGGLLEKVVGTPKFAAPSDFNGTGACCLTRIFTSW